MSTFRAPVVPYQSEPHPNADALEMAVIDGWRAACRLGAFEQGQKVAYIPEGALLPWDLVEELGLADPPRLSGKGHNRVKVVRLRGEISQGLVYAGPRIDHLEIGDDAVEALNLEKWEPEIPVHMAGLMMAGGPQINFDIDNIKSWPDRFNPQELVVVTEKMHGTFCCLGLTRKQAGTEPEPVVSSKGNLAQGRRFDVHAEDNQKNLYVKAWNQNQDGIRKAFDHLTKDIDGPVSVYLFGEIVGPKVQDLNYGQKQPSFYLFDVRTDEGYCDWPTVVDMAELAGVSTVPQLHIGPWSDDILPTYTDGQSTIAEHVREGVVVKPLVTRYDTGLHHDTGRGPGRVVFKSVSAGYLLRKGGTEYN